jgi:hypothetical protein
MMMNPERTASTQIRAVCKSAVDTLATTVASAFTTANAPSTPAAVPIALGGGGLGSTAAQVDRGVCRLVDSLLHGHALSWLACAI